MIIDFVIYKNNNKNMMNKQGNDLVTKKYLDSRLRKFKTELKTELKEELRADLKSDLYDIKDEIVKEIKDLREEFQAHQFSHIRINDDLQDHEKGLKGLETAPKN